jgi:hypothetical protein
VSASVRYACPWAGAVGVFLVVLAVYVLTAAGRIDIIDGQVRYDVAATWLDTGHPGLRDPYLSRTLFALRTDTGTYGAYNAGASVAAMPLLLLSRALPGHTVERDRFTFTMTGAVFGAAASGVLVLAYGALGLSGATSVAWALAAAFTTMWWPGSVTVFDQNQHGALLLAAVLLAWMSGRHERVSLSALGGTVAGALIAYQEIYTLILPFAALPVFANCGEGTSTKGSLRRTVDRASLIRYVSFGVAAGLGVLAFVAFNYVRFGTASAPGRYDGGVLFGSDRLAAILSFTVSPGKSIVLFSPPVVLAAAGAFGMLRRAPTLTVAILLVSLIHGALVLQLTFFGGDWCWGPRYLLVLVPLWALAAPFAAAHLRPVVVIGVLAAGLSVQVLAVSVDHQRFFFHHDLRPHFWLDQWAYFKRSQLLDRPRELVTVLTQGVPPEATRFAPTPQGDVTYTPASPRTYDVPGRIWSKQFAVFHVLRPWPLWLRWVDPGRRPVDPRPLLAVCGVLFAGGGLFIVRAVRRRPEALQ